MGVTARPSARRAGGSTFPANRRLYAEQATMANTLARMERDGLVTRQKDAGDARAQRIWISDRARALRDPAIGAAQAGNDDMFDTLSAAERAQFIALLRKIIASQTGGET
ncbi:MAG: MarR family winged helix-turn-helix transcriptional regulator [Rhodobacterales bacterium]|nr:MarR family winged helix-turn-helix transcriptional regulator [Rhodobacterales bacterium]